MPRSANPYGFTACAVCDDVTASKKVPPVCRDCLWLVCAGRLCPRDAVRSVRDALAVLTAYRARLGVLDPPTTACRQRWCLDYCRARGVYLRAHSGRLRPAVPVPRTVPANWHGTVRVKQPPTRNLDTTPAPGP